tara:strand:+ start:702 stop:1787 length:1086 start_codon:yes stop_codon:yes gene_type:complete
MCIIIIKQKRNTIPTATLKNSARINPHGLGIVWLDTYEVSYHTSREYKLLKTTRPFIAHFRYATIGKVGKDNTHPFVCGENTDELLMMNGTIRELGNSQTCDTKVLANALGKISRANWKKELSKYNCRFVSINKRNRSFQIYNKHLYTKKDGVWYSKDNVIQDHLVAVYGTLKKGYSNYHHHLRSSNFIGKGKTCENYPLVIKGLPYLIEERGKGYKVEVDIFSVSKATLRSLDVLEGHPRFYERKQINVVANGGKRYLCWVYFNRTTAIDSNTLFHSTYEQRPLNTWLDEANHLPPCTQFSFEDDINTSSERFAFDELNTEESPICPDCFHDVAYDGYAYQCLGCGNKLDKEETINFNNY